MVTNPYGWGDLPRIWVDDTFKGNGKIKLSDEEEKKLEILQAHAKGECFDCRRIIDL